MMAGDVTTIQISKVTRDQLRQLGMKGETYDQVPGAHRPGSPSSDGSTAATDEGATSTPVSVTEGGRASAPSVCRIRLIDR